MKPKNATEMMLFLSAKSLPNRLFEIGLQRAIECRRNSPGNTDAPVEAALISMRMKAEQDKKLAIGDYADVMAKIERYAETGEWE